MKLTLRPLILLPFKLARTHPRYLGAEVLVLSVGKSGRTWLRVLLGKYLSLRYGIPMDLGDPRKKDPSLPSVVFAHEMWLHKSEASLLDTLMMKHVIPDAVLWGKKIVLLVRDPRDVVVSLYFQVTRRSSRTRDAMRLSIGEFISHERLGVESIVSVMNSWLRRLEGHPDFMLLRYEDMKEDAAGELRRLLGFCGFDGVDEGMLAEAVEFASFDSMKKMEADGTLGSAALRPADPLDPNSFKVREGSVGGYAKHFTPDEIALIEDAAGLLEPFFGYGTT